MDNLLIIFVALLVLGSSSIWLGLTRKMPSINSGNRVAKARAFHYYFVIKESLARYVKTTSDPSSGALFSSDE